MGSVGSRRGGGSVLFDGKKDRYRFTASRHSASSATSRSATPDTLVCTSEPPISSSVTSSPVAAFTRWRPARVHVVRELAVLDERPGIEEQVEPLTHRQLAEAALALDALGPAHGECRGLAFGKIGDQRAPVVAIVGVGHGQ